MKKLYCKYITNCNYTSFLPLTIEKGGGIVSLQAKQKQLDTFANYFQYGRKQNEEESIGSIIDNSYG